MIIIIIIMLTFLRYGNYDCLKNSNEKTFITTSSFSFSLLFYLIKNFREFIYILI